MDDKVLTAIIASLSALLGSLIPTVIGYLNKKEQREFDFERELLSKQQSIYLELMLALQGMVNKQGKEQFIELQKASIKVSILGDNKTAKAFNEYYTDVVQSGQNIRGPLTQQEHQKHQMAVLNSMREVTGLDPLDNFEVVGFRPDAKNENENA